MSVFSKDRARPCNEYKLKMMLCGLAKIPHYIQGGKPSTDYPEKALKYTSIIHIW
jgi:hypothetical protein